MKKRRFLIAAALTMALTGCAAPAAPATDNSAEIESLKTQIEELSKENEFLKAQLETASAPTAAEADAPKPDAGALLEIGEEGALGDWSITVTDSQILDSVSDNKYTAFNPEEGNKYFLIDVTITNNGKNASSFLPSFGFGDDISAKVLYQNEYEFSATNLLGYSKELHDTTVNPLSTKSGSVAFELPDSVVTSEEELILSIQAGSAKLNFKVR